MSKKILSGLRQSVVACARDTQKTKINQTFCESHNLWSAAVEIKLPVRCRLGALKESRPCSRQCVPVWLGV
ncbi:hypothetical protein [Cereibacter sphaeroides]|uniref:hypothetical protein n=1 Tax=Cereibacter sphaeroides TaxID=1063 RepID=UPI0011313B2F|nr:hypothetical protein [Cereibacter sphaeroides]